MNRLQSELHRLYLPQATAGQGAGADIDTDPDTATEAGAGAGEPTLFDAGGHTRAMVLELARPASWSTLSAVWKGVQADLGLPAPAIAVSGQDGCQLWFSLAQPQPVAQARAFLTALRGHYLGEVDASRLRLLPTPDPDPAGADQARHARLTPAPQAGGERWSAFVAADLAAMFADEPWLDMAPNQEGQAELLARLGSIEPADFQRALAQLVPAPAPGAVGRPPAMESSRADGGPGSGEQGAAPLTGRWQDPGDFLLAVMNDGTVALALRIEAAKALLPYRGGPTRPGHVAGSSPSRTPTGPGDVD
jgi:hypothetical protein